MIQTNLNSVRREEGSWRGKVKLVVQTRLVVVGVRILTEARSEEVARKPEKNRADYEVTCNTDTARI